LGKPQTRQRKYLIRGPEAAPLLAHGDINEQRILLTRVRRAHGDSCQPKACPTEDDLKRLKLIR
jgi:hypothetical protein